MVRFDVAGVESIHFATITKATEGQEIEPWLQPGDFLQFCCPTHHIPAISSPFPVASFFIIFRDVRKSSFVKWEAHLVDIAAEKSPFVGKIWSTFPTLGRLVILPAHWRQDAWMVTSRSHCWASSTHSRFGIFHDSWWLQLVVFYNDSQYPGFRTATVFTWLKFHE